MRIISPHIARRIAWRLVVAFAPLAASFTAAWADTVAGERPSPTTAPQSSEAGASATVQDAQNPFADVISIPFQNNTYFGTGPEKKAANSSLPVGRLAHIR